MNDTTIESTTGSLEVGARVVTPDGPGRLDGFQVDTYWTFGRPARRGYIVVTLDKGGRRIYPAAQIGAR